VCFDKKILALKESEKKGSSPVKQGNTTRWISPRISRFAGTISIGRPSWNIVSATRLSFARSPSFRAIRVYLGVKSISSSWLHANERCCKRRPTSRMRDPRDRADNTRKSTMPVSSAFLVCQAHVKARLRESPLPFLASPLSHFPAFLCLSFLFSHFPHLHPCTFPSLAFLSLIPFVLSRVVDTTVTVTNDTDVPRGYNGFKSRSFHLIRGHSSPASTYELSPCADTGSNSWIRIRRRKRN